MEAKARATMIGLVQELAAGIEAAGETASKVVVYESHRFEDALKQAARCDRAFCHQFASVQSLDMPVSGDVRASDYPHYAVLRPIQDALPALLPSFCGHAIMAQIARREDGELHSVVALVTPEQEPTGREETKCEQTLPVPVSPDPALQSDSQDASVAACHDPPAQSDSQGAPVAALPDPAPQSHSPDAPAATDC